MSESDSGVNSTAPFTVLLSAASLPDRTSQSLSLPQALACLPSLACHLALHTTVAVSAYDSNHEQVRVWSHRHYQHIAVLLSAASLPDKAKFASGSGFSSCPCLPSGSAYNNTSAQDSNHE